MVFFFDVEVATSRLALEAGNLVLIPLVSQSSDILSFLDGF